MRLGERAGRDLRDSDRLPRNCSAREIAEHHGFTVVIEERVPPPFRGVMNFELMLLLVAPQQTPERTDFLIAHELCHHVFLNALRGPELEAAVQRAAAATKMPAAEFKRSIRELGPDPRLLQTHWPHCSLTAIAFRTVDLYQRLVCSVYFDAQRTRTHASAGVIQPLFIEQIERDALSEPSLRRRGISQVENFGYTSTAYLTQVHPRSAIIFTEPV